MDGRHTLVDGDAVEVGVGYQGQVSKVLVLQFLLRVRVQSLGVVILDRLVLPVLVQRRLFGHVHDALEEEKRG